MAKKLHFFRTRGRKDITTFPVMFCVDYMSSQAAMKKYGDRVSFTCMFYNNASDFTSAVGFEDEFKRIGVKLLFRYLKNESVLDKMIAWSEERKDFLRDYLAKNLNSTVLPTLSNQELMRRFHKYIGIYRQFHFVNTPSWWIGADAAAEELRASLIKDGVTPTDDLVAVLTNPARYQSESALEEVSLLKIAREMQKAKMDLSSYDNLPAKLKTQLKKQAEQYGYIPFGYNTGTVWDKHYFFTKIKEILTAGENPDKILKERQEKIKGTLKKQKQLVKELKLSPKTVKLAAIIQKLSYLQEIKKAAQTKSHPALQREVYPEIGRRIGVKPLYAAEMPEAEIEKALLKGKVPPVAELEQRRSRAVFVSRNFQDKWFYGKKADDLFKKYSVEQEVDLDARELKGQPACKGRAQGRVKLCTSSTEIGKVEEGDILVTAMTTPDYVPAMKKAAAVITDEGGLTCHAAIVARELGKPCIIGTKIATKVLKDGDLVEVDAGKGVVKILDKNEKTG